MAGKIWVDKEGNRYRRHFASQVSINKASGTKILVSQTEDPGAYENGLKWQTACLDHATVCNHRTLRLARDWATQPDWCGPCQHIIWHEDAPIEECLAENFDCAYDPYDLSLTRTDVNDDVEIGTRYRFELIVEVPTHEFV